MPIKDMAYTHGTYVQLVLLCLFTRNAAKHDGNNAKFYSNYSAEVYNYYCAKII